MHVIEFSEAAVKPMNTTTSRISIFSADNLGIWASALCVVHCIATPFLISMSVVMAHLIPGEERTHRTLAVGIAILGAMALAKGYRTHKRLRVLATMAAGLAFIFFGAFFADRLPRHSFEVGITMMGSVLMMSAHRMNHSFCRECSCCTH
jgi:hypothetical protein